MAEIPYPVAKEPPNPLQQMEGYQNMAARAQTMQQQAIMNRAKMAIGQHAQSAFDPETGQIDTNKWLGAAAADPNAAPLYADIAKEALDMGLLDAQKHGKLLENQQRELDFTNKAMAGLVGKDSITDSDVVGEFARIGVGTGRGSKWAMQKTQEYMAARKAGMFTPQTFVRSTLQSSEEGLKALEANGGTFRQLMQQQQVWNPQTQQMENIPMGEVYRRQGIGMAEGGGLAPPATLRAGQGSYPSGSPATPGVATGPSAQEEEYIKSMGSQWTDLRKEVASNLEAATSSRAQLEEMKGLLDQMGYDTGTLAPEKLQLAKLAYAFGGKDILQEVMGTNTVEDAIKKMGASEAFDKTSIIQKTEALRAAMGASNKLTNTEFKTFQDALIGLHTSPEGIRDIMDYMEKMNALAKEKADFLDYFEQKFGHAPNGRDRIKFERDWSNWLIKHPELYKFGANKEKK